MTELELPYLSGKTIETVNTLDTDGNIKEVHIIFTDGLALVFIVATNPPRWEGCIRLFLEKTDAEGKPIPSQAIITNEQADRIIAGLRVANERLTAELDQFRTGPDDLLEKLRDDEAAEVVRVTGRSEWPGEKG